MSIFYNRTNFEKLKWAQSTRDALPMGLVWRAKVSTASIVSALVSAQPDGTMELAVRLFRPYIYIMNWITKLNIIFGIYINEEKFIYF